MYTHFLSFLVVIFHWFYVLDCESYFYFISYDLNIFWEYGNIWFCFWFPTWYFKIPVEKLKKILQMFSLSYPYSFMTRPHWAWYYFTWLMKFSETNLCIALIVLFQITVPRVWESHSIHTKDCQIRRVTSPATSSYVITT